MTESERATTPARPQHAAGQHRVDYADLFNAEVRRHDEHFRAAARVQPRDRVLDIACGTGQSTRDAARAAVEGSVLGVDISAPALQLARRRNDAEGLRNVSYLQADAQVHRFPPARFDLCISRFGAMFFTDPVAAFTNIGHALRPGARLVLLVWQAYDRNEWATAVRRALAGDATPTDTGSELAPFSFGDPATVESILTAADFTGIGITDVHEPVYYGPDTATGSDFVLGLRHSKDLLAAADAATTERALPRLRATLAEHETDGGVFFDSRAWVVTAQYGAPRRTAT